MDSHTFRDVWKGCRDSWKVSEYPERLWQLSHLFFARNAPFTFASDKNKKV